MENDRDRSHQQVDPTTYQLDDITEFNRDAAVTFGVFDGIHIGHQAVINTLLARAHTTSIDERLGRLLSASACVPRPRTMSTAPNAALQTHRNSSTTRH